MPSTCELYVIVETHPGAIQQLAAALDAAPIAAVLLRPANGSAMDVTVAKSLVALAQSREVAALLADDAALARTLRADGVHLSSGVDLQGRYQTAREICGSRAMIGVDPGASRHQAMELAELNADYVAFGLIPEDDDGFDRDALLAWWAEIFEIPCVALDIADATEAQAVARTGADFIGIVLPEAAGPKDVPALIAGYVRAVQASAPV
jgi:thiamine-phosphate pyrophosphorylase